MHRAVPVRSVKAGAIADCAENCSCISGIYAIHGDKKARGLRGVGQRELS